MSAFVAQYAGPCAAGDRIEPGDRVVYVNDELVHVDCEGPTLTQLDRDAQKRTCTVCWLVESPSISLGNIMAFSSRDWGADREDAWLYGIVMGWGLAALAELAQKHRWSPDIVRRLRLLHLSFRRAQVHS